MKAADEFDVFSCALDGINLIEASAGTGKTWNICGLYLRLLLERGLRVQDILVVTFTNAATAELRERVRARIAETLAFLRGGNLAGASGGPFVAALVAAVGSRAAVDREQMAKRLDVALHYFDEAAIFTIHGFCQRALADASFSAGLPFSLQLVTDDSEMAMEAVRDFWRRRIAGDACPPELSAYLCRRRDSPEKFLKLFARSLKKPLAQCRWPADSNTPATIDTTEATAAYEAARATWAVQRNLIAPRLRSHPALNQGTYKEQSVADAIADWDAYLREGSALASMASDHHLHLLSRSGLARRTNKGRQAPSLEFFDAADLLLAARDAALRTLDLARLSLIRDLIETVAPDLRQRKREQRVIAFDDMLHDLHAALESGDHLWLAASLRLRFPAALIDEFQDTDPLQFAIFDRIYGTGSAPVFLVGDPKQAIYSFRNADLHAYLRARQRATAQYTLADNQRSTQGLITALNGLFAATTDAFMLPGLVYHPVEMGTRERKPFSDASQERADLQVWTLPQAPEGGPIAKDAARYFSVRATAAEIARLITAARNGRIAIGERALASADIAVLVRTHAQGSEMKRELASLNIGSVELAQASVFQSPEAEEVERVLIAINQPTRDVLLRGALATEMMGCDAGDIVKISGDAARLVAYLERFASYRDLWRSQGVGVMYRRLLTEERVSARMLQRTDGERRLTNLLHLGEQLHQAAATHEAPDALLRWLAARRREDSTDEVAQLRLESDRNLVQIVTIHKAKGLEYPIVFCPFLWDGNTRFGGPKPEGREYHDADGAAVIDFRLDDEIGADLAQIKEEIKEEEAAESLRLMYVAMTRAVYRCYAIAGTYRLGRSSTAQSTRSLLNWLVAGGRQSPAQWFAGKRSPADIAAAWGALAERLAPCLALAPLPVSAGEPVALDGSTRDALAALPPPKTIAPAWRYGSFTGFISDPKNEVAADDHDARIAERLPRFAAPPPGIAPDDILRFPRGPSAGDCLHAILQRIDFTRPAGWPVAVARGLSAHPQSLPGVRAPEQSPLLTAMALHMLTDVMHTSLPGGAVLGSIPAAHRLIELEFNLPAPRVSANVLNATLKNLGYDVPRLAFRALEGYLRGVIDLVFLHGGRYYVLDWKSNHLGYAPADYEPDALREAMREHSYHLQYLLYALAVDRYLEHRLHCYRHDKHFGGVLYLFVRGVRPDWINRDGTPAGVFYHRPTAAALARLRGLFDRLPLEVSP